MKFDRTITLMDKFDCSFETARKIKDLVDENKALREKIDLYKSLNRAMKMGEYSNDRS